MIDFDETLIKASHVREAIRRFLRNPVVARPARSAFLLHKGQQLPAKHILRLAFEAATGTYPAAEQLTGGRASVRVLDTLGFKAVYDDAAVRGGRRNLIKSARREALRKLLAHKYGGVSIEHKQDEVIVPDLSKRSLMPKPLRKVLERVEAVRGYRIEGKTGHRLSFDLFISKPGIFIEYDERQHFTPARAAALAAYPRNVELGFDKARWIRLCHEIRAGDNNPKYRDEQRAFYDTIRDLSSVRLDLPPVIRIYEHDVRWENSAECKSHQARAILEQIDVIARKSNRRLRVLR